MLPTKMLMFVFVICVFLVQTNVLGQNKTVKLTNSQHLEQCNKEKDLILVNGKIITMNKDNEIATKIKIRNKRIVAIGNVDDFKGETFTDKCSTIIDLKGHTVIPGLIDSHLHFVRQGLAPGYDVREVESATSIQQFLRFLNSAESTVPKNKVVMVLGGISLDQLKEKRIPNLKEFDSAVSKRPLYVQIGFAGPVYTNSLGIKYFMELGISVDGNGVISKGKETAKAFAVLQSKQNLADQIRSTKKLMTYANSMGLTMVFDEGGTGFPGASYFYGRDEYKALMDINGKHESTLRVKIQHTSTSKTLQRDIYDEKIENTFPFFGNDMLRYSGTGEHIVSFPINGKVNSIYSDKIKATAALGWSHEQHSVSYDENKQHLAMIAKINKKYGIKNLRWSLSHVFELGMNGTEKLISELKSMKMGLRLQNHGYYAKTDVFPLGRTMGGENSGPLYRTLYDHGIPLSAGTDGSLLGPMNPWFSIYYMVTGKNNEGVLVNPNQYLTRLEALELYTRGSAWFGFDEEKLGSLEVGKLADLVVLNKNYLTVDAEEIRTIKSVLTIVDGRIVYQDKL